MRSKKQVHFVTVASVTETAACILRTGIEKYCVRILTYSILAYIRKPQ